VQQSTASCSYNRTLLLQERNWHSTKTSTNCAWRS
jgi:hypothetical protein